jgi:hypothetical protein
MLMLFVADSLITGPTPEGGQNKLLFGPLTIHRLVITFELDIHQ